MDGLVSEVMETVFFWPRMFYKDRVFQARLFLKDHTPVYFPLVVALREACNRVLNVHQR